MDNDHRGVRTRSLGNLEVQEKLFASRFRERHITTGASKSERNQA